jgi:hypothetical protein
MKSLFIAFEAQMYQAAASVRDAIGWLRKYNKPSIKTSYEIINKGKQK